MKALIAMSGGGDSSVATKPSCATVIPRRGPQFLFPKMEQSTFPSTFRSEP